MISLTTTGHVDIVGGDESVPGTLWEVVMGLGVGAGATLVFIYVNANCTSMMLRLNQQLEQYRTRLQGIDLYLKRNQVSRDVQKRIKVNPAPVV